MKFWKNFTVVFVDWIGLELRDLKRYESDEILVFGRINNLANKIVVETNFNRRSWMSGAVSAGIAGCLFGGCKSAPMTVRKQLLLIPESPMDRYLQRATKL